MLIIYIYKVGSRAPTLRSVLSKSVHVLNQLNSPVEVPVCVDEVTKWVTGVTPATTCDNIIEAILDKHNKSTKVTNVLFLLYQFYSEELKMRPVISNLYEITRKVTIK